MVTIALIETLRIFFPPGFINFILIIECSRDCISRRKTFLFLLLLAGFSKFFPKLRGAKIFNLFGKKFNFNGFFTFLNTTRVYMSLLKKKVGIEVLVRTAGSIDNYRSICFVSFSGQKSWNREREMGGAR